MTSSHHFYDITPTVFDMVSTVSGSSHPLYWWYHTNSSLRSHPLYMTTSYPLCMTSQPLNVCHHTNYFNDITPFACRTSNPLYVKYHALYKAAHPHVMILHHIIYDITCTVNHIKLTIYEIASTVSVSSQRLYWWSQNNCMYDITPTLRMPSFALYTTLHPLFMTSHHYGYHITSTAFMTSHTLYMTSHTWQ